MDSMDLKGIAWVGHIYQKFEAMCLEVEEAMSQETAKYVENQVQTVGAGMKRFCSDVMQDLLPPSSKDLSRAASSDLLLNPYLEFGIHKKPISNIKEDAIKINPIKGISEEKSNSEKDVWEDWSAASFNWEISDKDDENCKNGDDVAIKALNKTPVKTVFTKSSGKVVKRSRRVSSSNILRVERKDTCESSGMVSSAGSQACSNTSTSHSIHRDVSHTDSSENSGNVPLSQIGSNVSANTKCGQSAGDEIVWSHTGSPADCDPDSGMETKTDASLQIMEPTGNEFESEFEETCVLVDGNECFPDNPKEEIKRSYKKKIRNAFSLKKQSARKQEYKKLAAQCSTINAETNIKHDKAVPVEPVLPKNIKADNPDSLESEWELL